MKNKRIKVYLHFKNLFQKEALPENIDAILDEIKDIGQYNEFKIYISYTDADFHGLGAKINTRTKEIRITKLMVFHYVKNYNTENAKDYINALRITKGHEMSHIEDYPRLPPLRSSKLLIDRKLIFQLNEVHADFSGAVKMAGGSRQNLVDACIHKKKLNDKWIFDKDNGDFKHPSWSRRIEYAKNFNFDKTLIRKIAMDVKCQNEELIQECIEYFDEIILK